MSLVEDARPTPEGLLRVTVRGVDVTVDSPVPFRLQLADGSTIDGQGRWSSPKMSS